MPTAQRGPMWTRGQSDRLFLPAQGDEDNPALYPPLQSGNAIPGAIRVGSYSPHGDSPFGVADLVGNVWQ